MAKRTANTRMAIRSTRRPAGSAFADPSLEERWTDVLRARARAAAQSVSWFRLTAARWKLQPKHRVVARRLYANRRRQSVEESGAFLAFCQIEWPRAAGGSE